MAQWVNDLTYLSGIASSIPSPAQWIKDLAIATDAAQIWFLALELPYAVGEVEKEKKKKNDKLTVTHTHTHIVRISIEWQETSVNFKKEQSRTYMTQLKNLLQSNNKQDSIIIA